MAHILLNTRFAVTQVPTPVFNTADLHTCFGGADGNTLPLDDQSLMRTVETVLFPDTKVELVEQVAQPNIWKIRTKEYPYAGDFFTDERFLKLHDAAPQERKIHLPSLPAILKTLNSLVGTRYIWGGAWPEGVGQLHQYYPSRVSLDQLDPLVRDTWTLRGVDCSGLLHYASDGWTERNTSKLLFQGNAVDIEGLNAEEIVSSLQDLDIIVWAGHMVCVFDHKTTIESIRGKGVVKSDSLERVSQIMADRKPVNDWKASDVPRFVVRRWHPNNAE